MTRVALLPRGLLALFFVVTSACNDRVPVVSCVAARVGMCHEWLQRTEGERRELEQAVCHKSDERFVVGPCPRADLLGTCEIEKTRERSLWYRSAAPPTFDAAAECRTRAGQWVAAP